MHLARPRKPSTPRLYACPTRHVYINVFDAQWQGSWSTGYLLGAQCHQLNPWETMISPRRARSWSTSLGWLIEWHGTKKALD